MDLDGDGTDDLISGSYDPGHLYLFRGLGKGKFAARQEILNSDKKPVLSHPEKEEAIESFGSFLTTVDWDDDGDLDLVIGTFGGEILLCLNEGTRTKPAYRTRNTPVQAAGKPIQLPSGHAAVVAADWDGDGRFDLLSGCDDGGVYLFRNTGKKGAPAFAAAQVLVTPHVGIGYEELQLPGQPVVPGIRAQIAVCDYNGDGKLDLLLGDFCTTRQIRADLSPADMEKLRALLRRRAELEPQREKVARRFKEELRKFWEPIPVKEQLKPEVQKKYREAVKTLEKSEWYRAVIGLWEEIDRDLQGYLAKPDKPGLVGDRLSAAHGYVWLYLRR